MRPVLRALGFAVLSLAASPVMAQEEPAEAASAPRYASFEPAARDAWLADCRQRLSARDSGLGGAAIGGVVGGIAGNRIAGRGNRTIGTVAGAAVGAVAGAAIDKAEDRSRNRDECEAYLDDYYARYTQGAGYAGQGYYMPAAYYVPGYGYGYGAGYGPQPQMQAMMVPAAGPQQAQSDCTETVEYVDEDEPVRPARRVIPRRPQPVADKRVRLK